MASLQQIRVMLADTGGPAYNHSSATGVAILKEYFNKTTTMTTIETDKAIQLPDEEPRDGEPLESLPGVPKADLLIVKIKDGEQEYKVQLKPVQREKKSVPVIAATRLEKGARESLDDRYQYGEEVVAYQRMEEGRAIVWEAVEAGVIITPVITYEGLKLAIMEGHNAASD
jgi:hypothetical protein